VYRPITDPPELSHQLPAPAKPKLMPEECRARHADRLTTIRLRMAIGRKLDDRSITTLAAPRQLESIEYYAADIHSGN
jgi:hypothetical protein